MTIEKIETKMTLIPEQGIDNPHKLNIVLTLRGDGSNLSVLQGYHWDTLNLTDLDILSDLIQETKKISREWFKKNRE